MKAIVTIIGPDQTGIIAAMCTALAERDVNIVDISQTVMQEFFTMTMLVDTEGSRYSFDEIRQALDAKGTELGLSVRIQNQEIFNAMHKI